MRKGIATRSEITPADAVVFKSLSCILRDAARTNEKQQQSGESDRLLRIAAEMAAFFADGKSSETDSQNFAFDLIALVKAARAVPGDIESEERHVLLRRAGDTLAGLTDSVGDVIDPNGDQPSASTKQFGDGIAHVTGQRETVEAASSELMGVLTLIHAAYDLSSTGGNLVDVGLMTSAESRLNDMLLMTRDRVVKSLELLDQVSA